LEEGKLDELGSLFDEIQKSDEKEIERIASNHYNRAKFFAMQFKSLDALQHYAKAYQYVPQNQYYSFAYATALVNPTQRLMNTILHKLCIVWASSTKKLNEWERLKKHI
jgi:hypothetical protein